MEDRIDKEYMKGKFINVFDENGVELKEGDIVKAYYSFDAWRKKEWVETKIIWKDYRYTLENCGFNINQARGFLKIDIEYDLELNLKEGDYVLATKYSDGDPKDHFAVGYFRNMTLDNSFNVVDENGELLRYNGFRRIKKIPKELGLTIINEMEIIKKGDICVWDYLKIVKDRDNY